VYDIGHGHPVYFSRDVWRELATVEAGGARAVVHQHAGEVLDIRVDDPGVLRDVDTLADLAD
jgi:CTP:molybdopterin cytidylyltransferase MocA